MIYNDPTNLQGFLQWVRNRTKSDENKFTEKLARSFLNAALDWYTQLVMFASGIWKFDDASHVDYPIIVANIVAGQQDYPLNSGILTIRRVEMKDINNNWTVLHQIETSEIYESLSHLSTVQALPSKYYLQDGALWLLSVPNTSVTNGLKIYYDRVMNYFNGTDGQEPGVPAHLHHCIGDYAAWLFAKREGLDSKTDLENDVAAATKQILNHISRRNYGKNIRIRVRSTPSK